MDLIQPGESLPDWLRARAASTPDRVAVITPGRAWTFADIDRRADRTAASLAERGVKPDDRVAVLLPNGVAFVDVVHALPRLGAALVPINLRLSPDEIGWQLSDVGAPLLVTDSARAEQASVIQQQHPGLGVLILGSGNGASGASTSGRVPRIEYHDPSDTHSIVYTSGTTGRPKGALLTHGNHLWNAIGSAMNLGVSRDDRWLAVLPLFHVGGLSILFRSVLYGIPVVVHEDFDPATVNRSIDEDRVTIISVVSAMLRRMLDERGDRPYPPWLRCVLLGGGPAPRPLLERCAALGVPVTQTYGLTETASQVATLAPEDALRKLGSAGKPLYPNEIAIAVDGRGAGVGEPGEILVRGPIVSAGYHARADESRTALRDGWLQTGDFGYLDGDGYLYVLDRRDDLIVTGGENVYPAEVEAALLAHPDVLEAGVVGEPDEEWGQRVVAVVRTHVYGAHDPEKLQNHCRSRLAGYKVPSRIVFVSDPLPRTASGKLRRRELRQA